MFTLSKPRGNAVQHFIAQQLRLPFTYHEVGQTREHGTPAGFNNDFNAIELGRGDAVFSAAKDAIRQWKMFPEGWTDIVPQNAPIREGEVVAVLIRVTGTWWLNSSRIIYVLDDARQFGFAYGTLPGHAECGEELFMVDMDEAGIVRYSIRAFSRPRHWMSWLAYPLTRAYQRKFVRESKASMLQFVQSSIFNTESQRHGDTTR